MKNFDDFDNFDENLNLKMIFDEVFGSYIADEGKGVGNFFREKMGADSEKEETPCTECRAKSAPAATPAREEPRASVPEPDAPTGAEEEEAEDVFAADPASEDVRRRAGVCVRDLYIQAEDIRASYDTLLRMAPGPVQRQSVSALLAESENLVRVARSVFRSVTGRNPAPYAGNGVLPRNYCAALNVTFDRVRAGLVKSLQCLTLSGDGRTDRRLLYLSLQYNGQMNELTRLLRPCR